MANAPHSSLLPLVELCAADLVVEQRTLLRGVSLAVRPSEIWQIHGSAGAGKSILLEILLGRHRLSAGTRRYPAFVADSPDAAIGIPPRFALRLVSQEEQRRVASHQASFYQARWHSLWTEPLTVAGFLAPERVLGLREYEVLECLPVRRDYVDVRKRCLHEMNLSGREQQLVGQLSNGELRKLRLIAAHLASPRVLLLDDPLGGLDPESRQCARNTILRWCQQGQTIVYCASYDDDLGSIATHHYYLQPESSTTEVPVTARERADEQAGDAARQAADRRRETEQPSTADRCESEQPSESKVRHQAGVTAAGILPASSPLLGMANRIAPVISCSGIRVTAGPKLLLDDVDWEVLPGQHWLVTGPNGAGKSTLLALLMGDHPQAYSNQIQVLGTRLGHGTSLWERRRTIGFVAPELSWHYPAGWSLLDVVLSGFDASIGSYREPSVEERAAAQERLDQFGLGSKSLAPLAVASEGEKRLTLLARAMVREPPLLLLDEPTQNVTGSARNRLFAVLDGLSHRTTLVLVTHHVEVRPHCISHHLALELGRIRYRGAVGEFHG